MQTRELMRRELGLVLRARVTWAVGAAAALLIGHSFVLAIDLFSAASESALGHALMQREMDPLAGIVRPVLGGLYLATTLLLPLALVRGLAIEKERGSYGMLALASGGTERVVLAKLFAACAGALMMLVPVLITLALYTALGGHLGLIETLVACSGHALHLLLIACASVGAAGVTRTYAQAATVAVCLSLASWAIDAGEGFSALQWLGTLDWISISHRLDPFEHGIVPLGGIGWFALAIMLAVVVALLVSGIDHRVRRASFGLALIALSLLPLRALGRTLRGYDGSQGQRASLAPAFVDALHRLDGPLSIEIWLDPEDGRRQHFERDALAKILLARPDMTVVYPLDRAADEPTRSADPRYGRIVVHVGDATRETRSASRREIVTLMFEAAGVAVPEWNPPPYPGYPCVVTGRARVIAVASSYGALPSLFVLLGVLLTRERRRSS